MAFLSGARKRLGVTLPEGPNFAEIHALQKANPKAARLARADSKLLAGLFLDDIASFISEAIDPKFGFSRYADKLAVSAPKFAPIEAALSSLPSPIDAMIDRIAIDSAEATAPDVLAVSIPFPGNLYAACRVAKRFRETLPSIKIIFGGGYVSTELRQMTDTGIFHYADALCFDAGEAPISDFATAMANGKPPFRVRQMATKERMPIETLRLGNARKRPLHDECPAPTYAGLSRSSYFAMEESPNPMLRLWSGRFWNKIVLSRGCYWHRCAFCDTSLDYVCHCDPAKAETIERWMDSEARETGETGFHFVDEAAPPATLRALSRRLAARNRPYEWWTNIRLEKAFDETLAKELAAGGCIAVSAGLECTTDRMLRLIDKGVTREIACKTCRAFKNAGIMTHIYMMHGYPTQTLDEIIEDLDFLRELFAAGAVQSAYWHQFALTCHSRAYQDMQALGIRRRDTDRGKLFARNEVPYIENDPLPHAEIGRRLNAALFNYQNGVALDIPAREWF